MTKNWNSQNYCFSASETSISLLITTSNPAHISSPLGMIWSAGKTNPCLNRKYSEIRQIKLKSFKDDIYHFHRIIVWPTYVQYNFELKFRISCWLVNFVRFLHICRLQLIDVNLFLFSTLVKHTVNTCTVQWILSSDLPVSLSSVVKANLVPRLPLYQSSLAPAAGSGNKHC